MSGAQYVIVLDYPKLLMLAFSRCVRLRCLTTQLWSLVGYK